jgi:aspartate aminotransferase
MQYAVPELETLSIDQAALVRRRDRLIPVMRQAGYEPLMPEGTFYLWSKWPDGDPDKIWNALADRDVFVLPGSVMNAEGYLRISLTASDAMWKNRCPYSWKRISPRRWRPRSSDPCDPYLFA